MNENAFASPLPPPSSSSPASPAGSSSGSSTLPPSVSNPPETFQSVPVELIGEPSDGAGKNKETPLNSRIADIIEKIISHIPDTQEPISNTPEARSRHIVSRAATTAGLVSGGLAIPPGPLAFATVIPDLYAIWKIQSQMIADIAAAYGKKAELRREHMLYCLFRHITSQVARDIVVRVGQRLFIRPGSLAIMNRILSLVGKEITQRVAARTASAWVPLIGAAAVGGYAWYDTRVVGYTAIALFSPSDSKEIPAGANAAAAALPAETAADKLPVPDPDMGGLEGFVDLPPVPSSPSPEIIPPAPDEIIR